MRDPSRIPEVLKVLAEVWDKNPDLRLGQLVYIAAASDRDVPPCPPLFYMEDDAFLSNLKSLRGGSSMKSYKEKK